MLCITRLENQWVQQPSGAAIQSLYLVYSFANTTWLLLLSVVLLNFESGMYYYCILNS